MGCRVCLASILVLSIGNSAEALDVIPPIGVRLQIDYLFPGGSINSTNKQLSNDSWEDTVVDTDARGVYSWKEIEREPEFLILEGPQGKTHMKIMADGRMFYDDGLGGGLKFFAKGNLRIP